MKKVILFSFFIIASALMTSCTADAIADTPQTQNSNADDTGGQGIPPPPKPPGAGTGTGG